MPPTIPFPGSKGRLAKHIVALLPKQGRTYCEPFCGKGNLFWAAATAGLKYEKWWLNDISTIPFFRAVQRAGHTLKVPSRSREEYERQRVAYHSGDLNAELLQPFLTFNGGGYLDGGCKGRDHVTRDNHDKGVSGAGYERTIHQCHQIMRRTRPRLTSFDWRKMGLEELGPQDTAVFDPPYPGCNVGSYTDASLNYEELVDALLNARFRWVLCGYLHPVLHRLGRPIWARDVQLIAVPPDDKDSRTECLWSSNFISRDKRHVFPSTLSSRLRIQDQAASLSFTALDAKIDNGLETVAKDWNALVPYLLEMHRRLCAPGRRTDLRKGAPTNLSWEEWVQSKREKLGRSLRSIRRLLQGKTEASQRALERRPPASLAGGSMKTLPSAMGLAFEMARLILEMRDSGKNTRLNKRRLERLASQFLSVAERRSVQRSDSIPADRIGIGNRTSGAVTLTMQ